MERKKTYPDLRYLFIRGLLAWEMYQRRSHYLKSASEWTSKAIVSLDLSEDPVKSVKQASQLDGIGKEICKKLCDIQAGKLYSKEPPVSGKFVSSAPAILVTLLKTKRQMIANQDIPPEKCYITEDTIIALAPTMCEERFQNFHSDGEAFCPALWRMNVMCTKGLIKKRTLNKKPAYELLPMGERIAHKLEGKQFQQTTVKKRKERSFEVGHISTGLPSASNTRTPSSNGKKILEDALYTNDDGTDGLILLVDTQEWGGDRVGLGELIRLIKRYSIRYKTRKLLCGDYSWVWRCGEDEVLLPLLVERKRADDLARSLRDGRYINQKEKMLNWKNRFGEYGIVSSLKYLIEGKPEQYAVKCMDGCGAVIKCGFPTVKQLQEKISEIDNDPNFELIQTEDIAATIQYLNSVNMELKRRLNKGDFDELLFKQVKYRKDFSKTTPKKNKVKKSTPELQNTNMDNNIIVLDDNDSQEYESQSETTTMAKCERSTIKKHSKYMDCHSQEMSPKRVILDKEIEGYFVSEDSRKKERQEMLDIPFGQYHCSKLIQISTPKNIQPAIATVSSLSPSTKEELTFVRARISTERDNRFHIKSKKSNLFNKKDMDGKALHSFTYENSLQNSNKRISFDKDSKVHLQSVEHSPCSSKFLSDAKKKSNINIAKCDSYREETEQSTKNDNQEWITVSKTQLVNPDTILVPSGSESEGSDNDIIHCSDLSDDDGDILMNMTGKHSDSLLQKKGNISKNLIERPAIVKNSSEKIPILKLTPSASFTKGVETLSSPGKIYHMKQRTKKSTCLKITNENRDIINMPYNQCSNDANDKMLPDLADDSDNMQTTLFRHNVEKDKEPNLNNNKNEIHDHDMLGNSIPKSKTGEIKLKDLGLSSRYKKQMEDILNIVPNIDVYRVQTLLELYGGNADMVVSALFEDSSQNS